MFFFSPHKHMSNVSLGTNAFEWGIKLSSISKNQKHVERTIFKSCLLTGSIAKQDCSDFKQRRANSVQPSLSFLTGCFTTRFPHIYPQSQNSCRSAPCELFFRLFHIATHYIKPTWRRSPDAGSLSQLSFFIPSLVTQTINCVSSCHLVTIVNPI